MRQWARNNIAHTRPSNRVTRQASDSIRAGLGRIERASTGDKGWRLEEQHNVWRRAYIQRSAFNCAEGFSKADL